MFDLERELDAVRTKLSASGISYALCGGLAVGVYGGYSKRTAMERLRAMGRIAAGLDRVEEVAVESDRPGGHREAGEDPLDLSDAAISMRLRQVSQLRKLCLSLAKAKEKL